MKNSETRQFALAVIIIGIGVGCIAAGIIMAYQEKAVSIGNIPISSGLIFLVAGLILVVVSSRRSKTADQHVSPGVWYVALLIAIVFLIVYAFTHYKYPEYSQYTILVDLILIMLALTGAVGYGIYRWISRSVGERVASALKEGQDFTGAQVEVSLGFWYYQQYEAEIKRKEEIDIIWERLAKVQSDQENKRDSETVNETTDAGMICLEHAIARTTKALEFMKDLTEDKYEKFICVCKNNLAYYLAEKKRRVGQIDEGEEKLAIEYATFIWKRIQKYPDCKVTWADTYKFLTKQFPSKFD